MKYVVHYLSLISRTRRKYQSYLLFNQNAEKVSKTKREDRRRTTATSRCSWWSIWCLILYNQQNAEKVSETKREGRRRTTGTLKASCWKYTVLYTLITTRTWRRYQRRRRSTDGVLQVRRGIHDEVYDALYFIISRTRRRYQRRRERADGVLLLRQGPLDEVYDALYAFCPSLD